MAIHKEKKVGGGSGLTVEIWKALDYPKAAFLCIRLGGPFAVIFCFSLINLSCDFGNFAKFGRIMPLFTYKMAIFEHVFETANFGEIEFFLLNL